MYANTIQGEARVTLETPRYSTGMPAQAGRGYAPLICMNFRVE